MGRPPKIAGVEDHLFARLKAETGTEVEDGLTQKAELLVSSLFSHQHRYREDTADRKTLLCPRRSGKTWVFGIELLEDICTIPLSKVAYITLTAGQAKRNLWDTILTLNDQFNLALKFNHTELTVRSKIGGLLMLGGALTKADVDRWRGIFLNRAVVDEAGSFDPDLLMDLTDEVLHYALLDKLGVLTVGGTPGPVLAGPFWEASDRFNSPGFETKVDDNGIACCLSRPFNERNTDKYKDANWEWSHHEWAMIDNVALPHAWRKALEKHKRKGGNDHDPVWQREGLGHWVADSSAFVYRYKPRVNAWTPLRTKNNPFGLPGQHKWHFIAGVDLGYDDDFDIEVAAWSNTCDTFYHVDGFNSPGMTPTQCVTKIKEFDKKYNFDVIVGDTAGLGKAIFEEFRMKHNLPIVPARKQDKRDYIELTNSEFIAGRCKILKDSTLEGQLKTLQWKDPRAPKKVVHPKMDDHACDAWLYVTRYALHHFSRPMEAPGPERDTAAYWDARTAQDEREFEASLAAGPRGMLDKLGRNLNRRFKEIETAEEIKRFLH